jgi:methyl-CpG-binding domain protein 4
MNTKWKPPKSPIGMLQEDLWPDVWKILVACILHNQTSRKQVDKVYPNLFKLYPNATVMASADVETLADLLRPLGLYNRRARSLKRFSSEYSDMNWKAPSELFACGKYADDCFNVFCSGDWKNVNTDDGSLKRYVAWLRETKNA